MTKKVARIIVDVLQAVGVKHCYGIVGHTFNPIVRAIGESEIEWVHMRHEEAGAFAAQGKRAVIDCHATDDALITSDDGMATIWAHRYFKATSQCRSFGSVTPSTMASAMPMAMWLQKCQPNRQVISLSGDGGVAMFFGDLMTAVQEMLPIEIAFNNNSKLGFIHIERKSERLVPLSTDLLNPDFGKVAAAMGLCGRSGAKKTELEEAVVTWLSQSGPALLDVKVENMTLVMPPTIEFGHAYGMALYSARGVPHGQSHDLLELIHQNFL